MDLGMVLVGFILLAICIVPLVLIARSGKKHEKKMCKAFESRASEMDFKISKKLVGEHYVIGLDEPANSILFFKHNKFTERFDYLKLDEIRDCELKLKKTQSSTDDSTLHAIDKIELNLTYKNKNKPQTSLVFYDLHDTVYFRGELRVVQDWERLIRSKIRA